MVETLKKWVRESRNIVFFGGAGINAAFNSTAAGQKAGFFYALRFEISHGLIEHIEPLNSAAIAESIVEIVGGVAAHYDYVSACFGESLKACLMMAEGYGREADADE